MSNSARLTINGALIAKPDLFSGAAFPERLDRQTLIDTIILECGGLGLYYTNPNYMASAVNAWTRRRLRVWDEMIDTTEYDYNPIWNKDGVYREHRTDTRTKSGTDDSTALVGSQSKTEQEIQHGHTIDDDTTVTESVNAYNGGAWADASKTVTDGTEKHSGKDTTTTTGDYTGNSEDHRRSNEDEDGEYTLERVEQGNIGVTTTQQMIKEQREVIDYDVYYIIADEFKAYFCILVY